MKLFKLNTLGNDQDNSLAFINNAPDGIGIFRSRLGEGEKIGSNYPSDAKITLLKRSPGLKLCSFIGNTECMLVVADPVRDLIESTCECEMEILKFALLNQKGRLHSSDYWIINPIGTTDCVNREASDIDFLDAPGDHYHGAVVDVDRYVIDKKKLIKAPNLFRVPEDPEEYFFKEPLFDEIRKREFTNFVFEEIEVV